MLVSVIHYIAQDSMIAVQYNENEVEVDNEDDNDNDDDAHDDSQSIQVVDNWGNAVPVVRTFGKGAELFVVAIKRGRINGWCCHCS